MSKKDPINLEQLGFSKDEVLDRIVDGCVEGILKTTYYDEDGDPVKRESAILGRIVKKITEQVDKAVGEVVEIHILPNARQYVESICLQETNRWGEKKGNSVTFVEYLVKKAEEYLTEDVDSNGKNQKESQSSYWCKSQSRISHLVHSHLHYRIETAMQQAVKGVNEAFVGGLESTVRIKLEEILAKMKVNVVTK